MLHFYRLHEFDDQIAAVREGMSKVIPVPLLSLFTGSELETMVCYEFYFFYSFIWVKETGFFSLRKYLYYLLYI